MIDPNEPVAAQLIELAIMADQLATSLAIAGCMDDDDVARCIADHLKRLAKGDLPAGKREDGIGGRNG